MIRVIIAGEGKNELGSFGIEAAFREGWQVIDAILWKKLPKLLVGIRGRGEELNVLRAHHHARKRGCDMLVFTRDRDGVKDTSAMVQLIENRGLARIPGDARSLRRWLDRAREALGEDEPSSQAPA